MSDHFANLVALCLDVLVIRLQDTGKSLGMSGPQHSRTLCAKQKPVAVDKALLQEKK